MNIPKEVRDPFGPLPEPAQESFEVYVHERLEAETRLKEAWLLLPDDVWLATKFRLCEWVYHRGAWADLARCVAEEIDYERESRS